MNVVCYDGNKLVDELRLDEGNNISNELQLGYGLQSTLRQSVGRSLKNCLIEVKMFRAGEQRGIWSH